jgi:hypothetical protein
MGDRNIVEVWLNEQECGSQSSDSIFVPSPRGARIGWAGEFPIHFPIPKMRLVRESGIWNRESLYG